MSNFPRIPERGLSIFSTLPFGHHIHRSRSHQEPLEWEQVNCFAWYQQVVVRNHGCISSGACECLPDVLHIWLLCQDHIVDLQSAFIH